MRSHACYQTTNGAVAMHEVGLVCVDELGQLLHRRPQLEWVE